MELSDIRDVKGLLIRFTDDKIDKESSQFKTLSTELIDKMKQMGEGEYELLQKDLSAAEIDLPDNKETAIRRIKNHLEVE